MKELKVNIISSTSTEGIINCLSSIRSDGKHQGEINAANKIVIGGKAIINGTLIAEGIEIFGLMKGDCHKKSSVSFSPSASYNGNIYTNQVILFEGAFFNGNIEMPINNKEEPVKDKNPRISNQSKKLLQKIALFLFLAIPFTVINIFQFGGEAGSNRVMYNKNEVDYRKAIYEPKFHHLTSNIFSEIKIFWISISPTMILN